MFFALTAYLLAPVYLLALLWRGRREPGIRGGLGQRFGLGAPLPTPPVWLHAASVGEVQAAAILVAALRRRDPQLPLLLTVTTAAGLARGRTVFAAQRVEVRYVPLDLPGAVSRFLRRVRPRLAIILETEIWPNLIRGCEAARVPVLFVSARLSARSARRYRHLGALRAVLAGVAQVAAQTPQDAQRFIDLGVPAARVHVSGNLKADISVAEAVVRAGAIWRAALSPPRAVWVAGSTHEVEEQAVLEAHRALRRALPGALLVLVPRHPRRFADVVAWLQREHVPFVRQSDGRPVTGDTQVLLVDAMGLLLQFYAASDVVFVGGSLVPAGGHNLLEPAALGRPILTGPDHANARDVLQGLLAADAARVVEDGAQLGRALCELLGDAAARERMGANAARVVTAGRGAGGRVMAVVETFLDRPSSP